MANSVEFPYPAPPENVPANLADATPHYRLHAWLALFGLLVFAFLYLALTIWFGWSAYRIFTIETKLPNPGLLLYVKGFGSAILAIFLIKGLFFKKDSGTSKEFEITREKEPKLFGFLDRLARETGAPKPYKVYLSPEVNACVFYNLSILNFLFPSRKNLNIGLGLVNVLSLHELKAVLAHEFGHFAQNSMKVGRWVYIAQQVATQLIFHRDMLDRFITGLSRFDFRVAWIGWILQLVVWSIRSVLDTTLSLVMLAHRALSREMEFQADLVAVKSTGSDALINALYRLAPADSAWDETLSFVGQEIDKGHCTTDFFTIQSRIIEINRHILDDPDYGHPPEPGEDDPAKARIFTPDLAQPPQMWSTHPQNHLRENNAKKTYIPCELDNESAWVLFNDPAKLRCDLTKHLLNEVDKPYRDLSESLDALNQSYSKHYFDPAYRGAYLGRSIVSHTRFPQSLFVQSDPTASNELYPEHLTDLLEKNRNLAKEKALLTALRDRRFVPSDGVIRFRGDVIKRTDLGEAIETVTRDFETTSKELRTHDATCRSRHLELAQKFGQGWPEFLQATVGLIHYADHTQRNIEDAHALVINTYQVITADGNISNKELYRILRDSDDLYSTLKGFFQGKDDIVIDSLTRSHLEKENLDEYLETFKLPRPSAEILGDWLGAIDGWVGMACFALGELQAAALETLLDSEKLLREKDAAGEAPAPAPAPSRRPSSYPTMLAEDERTLQTKLNLWDSFQTASGVFPSIARLAAAATIVIAAIYITLPAR